MLIISQLQYNAQINSKLYWILSSTRCTFLNIRNDLNICILFAQTQVENMLDQVIISTVCILQISFINISNKLYLRNQQNYKRIHKGSKKYIQIILYTIIIISKYCLYFIYMLTWEWVNLLLRFINL